PLASFGSGVAFENIAHDRRLPTPPMLSHTTKKGNSNDNAHAKTKR
ncbi:hypothetical protein HMPREF1398_01213, partial [Helicobacter pylori GAM117Ai]